MTYHTVRPIELPNIVQQLQLLKPIVLLVRTLYDN
jgi:hypothetical protein